MSRLNKLFKIRALRNYQHFKKATAGVGISLFAVVGTILLFNSHAATPFASLEPEAGTRTANATIVSDNSASGGSAVKFGIGSTGGTRCSAYPAFPDASCTGVLPGIARTNYSGIFTTTSDGQVIENMNINGGRISVEHNDVVIKNVRVTNPGGDAIHILDRTGLVIEDCELDGTGNPDAASTLGEHNYTMRRCNVHHFGEGPRINGNVTLEDNYIHDFLNFQTGSGSTNPHQDGIQITSGDNIIIRHNNLVINVDGANGDIFTCCYGGGAVLIEKNLLGGGGWATTGGGDLNGRPIYPGTKIIDNHFTTKYFVDSGYFGPIGYSTYDEVRGNVWYDDYGSGGFGPIGRQYPNGDGPRKGTPI